MKEIHSCLFVDVCQFLHMNVERNYALSVRSNSIGFFCFSLEIHRVRSQTSDGFIELFWLSLCESCDWQAISIFVSQLFLML